MTVEQKDQFKKEFVNQHMLIVGVTQDEVLISDSWREDNPLSNDEYAELIQWGVESIADQLELTQTEAEKEISWLVMELGLEYNAQ
jgi:hypothetical protein